MKNYEVEFQNGNIIKVKAQDIFKAKTWVAKRYFHKIYSICLVD